MGDEQPPSPLEPCNFSDEKGLLPLRVSVKSVKHNRAVPHVFFLGKDGQPASEPLYHCPIYDQSLEGDTVDGDTPFCTWQRQVSDSSDSSMQSLESRESGRAMRDFLEDAIHKERCTVDTQHEHKSCRNGVNWTTPVPPITSATSTPCDQTASQKLPCARAVDCVAPRSLAAARERSSSFGIGIDLVLLEDLPTGENLQEY